MKIGVSSLATFGNKIEEQLEYLSTLNLDSIEILHDFPNFNINTETLKSFSIDYSIHSRIIDMNICSLNESISKSSINEIKKSIDLANSLDSEIIVVHPGKIPFLGKNYEDKIYKKSKESFEEIANYGKEMGVLACIENMPKIEGFMYLDLNKLNQLVEELEIAMTLDIGHAHTAGFTAEECYFDSIKHIHIHDNFGNEDSHLALGEGNFDLNQFFNIFSKNKYNGQYIIEVNNKESINKSLDYLKNKKLI